MVTLGRYARRPPAAMPAGDGRYCLGPANRAQRMRQAEISARPLRRRAARMARPARVRMRSRKPWVFARRRLFGWKVRLLTSGLQAQDASPAHGDARQWLACRMRGMRNSRRVASRPSYVTGQACPRSNRRVFRSTRTQVIHVSTGTLSTGASPSTGCALRPSRTPLGCGQRLVHSCGQGYCRPFQTLSPLRGRVGPQVTGCAQPVDSMWISYGAHDGATGLPACGQRRDPVRPAATIVDKQIAVGQRAASGGGEPDHGRNGPQRGLGEGS